MFSQKLNSLFLDVWTQAENVLLTGHFELVGEPEILHLNLEVEHRQGEMDVY